MIRSSDRGLRTTAVEYFQFCLEEDSAFETLADVTDLIARGEVPPTTGLGITISESLIRVGGMCWQMRRPSRDVRLQDTILSMLAMSTRKMKTSGVH